MRLVLLVLPLVVALAADRPRDGAKSGPVFETIARLDQHLSDAFNAHDIDRLTSLVNKDLEFFDQNDGMKTYPQTVDYFKAAFASNAAARREVVSGTMEVYPLKGYGALEFGEQRICHSSNGREECDNSKFVTIWQQTGDTWKLARLITYASGQR